MKQRIKLSESEFKGFIRQVIIESLGDRWEDEKERIYNKRQEHSISEYLKGKMDDIRHGLATMFGKEMSDNTYAAIVSGLSKQIISQIGDTGNADPDLITHRDNIIDKHGKGFDRRNFGFYRGENEVRPDTPEEVEKNAQNKGNMLQQRLQVALQKMRENMTEGEIQKYQDLIQEYSGQPNICINIGGFEGNHGGSGSFFCTNSKGQPFLLYDYVNRNSDYRWLQDIFSNDELYQYFPKTVDELR